MQTEENELGSGPSKDLEPARKANNTWTFEGKELEKYVARGEITVATNILNRATGKETGAKLLHHFKWQNEHDFVTRENTFKTNLRRVGRDKSQDVDMSHLVSVNGIFYKAVVDGGTLIIPDGNGKVKEEQLDKEKMVSHANLYPESASEAIESWLEIAKISFYSDEEVSFKFLFEAADVVNVLWHLGDRDNPIAAGILKFKAPTSERRRDYEQAVQKVKTEREGEVSTTKLETNFNKKIQYGLEHLMDVQGIAVGTEGGAFVADKDGKENFVILFNPIWFAEAIDVMHDSFDFMKGKSGVN